MSHPGARTVEPEEKEERGSGRSQNVVHTLPRSMASVPTFLTGPLERVEPSEGSTQVLVLTADPESSVAVAEAVLRMTGPAGIELVPITSARRGSRLMASRPVLAAAGTPRDIRDLLKGSHLKLDSIKSVVLAWAEEILAGDPDDIEALEAVMAELPKTAARIVVTSRSEGRVNAFAERYLRRAHRDAAVEEDASAAPISLQYVTVTESSRATGLRRLLDDLDPPSAAIVAANDEARDAVTKNLRLLGYAPDAAAIRVTRDEIPPSTYAVIFYEAPVTRAQLALATEAGAVAIVALVEPREVPALRRMAGGDVKPFTLAAPGNAAREREASLRRELASVIDAGVAARDVLALEPLLEHHDGVEIAAAALKLLEKERILRKAAESEIRSRSEMPAPAPAARPSFDRGPREFRGPRGESRGGDRGGARGGPPRRDSHDRRPPRDGTSRPPRRDR